MLGNKFTKKNEIFSFFQRMQREMMSMHEHMAHEMQRMRSQMFQLEPCEPSGNVVSELQPRHPIVEEKGEYHYILIKIVFVNKKLYFKRRVEIEVGLQHEGL